MDNNVVEMLVAEVLHRLKKKTLIVLTNAGGYKDEIYARIRQYGTLSFSIMIAEGAAVQHSENQWRQVGEIIRFEPASLPTALQAFDSVWVPFLDFETLGEIANGIFASEGANVINHALMQGMNVVALDYNCNPDSELNQVLGFSKNAAYHERIKHNIKTLIASGVRFCSMNEVESHLNHSQYQGRHDPKNESLPERYITLNDVMVYGKDYFATDAKLTDLAIEYIKSNKK